MYRLSQTGEKAVYVGVSCVADNDVGMAILFDAKRSESQFYFGKSVTSSRTTDLSTSDTLGVDSPGKFLCTTD